jgi:hypothetical protein
VDPCRPPREATVYLPSCPCLLFQFSPSPFYLYYTFNCPIHVSLAEPYADAPSDAGSPDVESPRETTAQSPSRTPTKSQPRRRAKHPQDLLIVSDSSPSPDPTMDIKVEPADSDVASKGAKTGNPKSRGGKQQTAKSHPSLAKKIEDLMETICSAEEEGIYKCSDFLRMPEKSDFEDEKDWENYHKIVKSPICLQDIQGQMNEYTSVAELSRDFSKLIQNARKVNAQIYDCFNHVDWLEEVYVAWSKTV